MKRLRLPDLLKGLAILFMVQVHIMELFIDFPGRESITGKVSLFIGGPFTAMVFMIVMGYFVAKSGKTIRQTVLRGIKIFILGLLLNIGLNFHLLLKIKFSGWPYHPLEYIFGVDILYLAGLSILILALLKTISRKYQSWISFSLLVVVLLLSRTMNGLLTFPERNYVTPFIGGTYSWSYFPLFPWLAYPVAGYFFFSIEATVRRVYSAHKIKVAGILTAIAITILYFFRFGFSTTTDLPAYYHHNFAYGIWALGLLMLWAAIFYFFVKQFPETKAEQFLAWMGKNITLIYVVQWLVIGNIATAIYQTQAMSKFPLWFAGIVFVTLVISWLLAKTRNKEKAGPHGKAKGELLG